MDDCPLLLAVLGPHLQSLPESVRNAHSSPLRASGTFGIEPAENWMSALLARVWQLPVPGKEVRTEVEVASEGTRQRWIRRFDGMVFETLQWAESGLIVETRGLGRMGLQLRVVDGSLRYQTVRAWIGPVPLPRFLVPCVDAEVSAAEAGWRVSVTIRQSGFGVLCRYSGNMRPE